MIYHGRLLILEDDTHVGQIVKRIARLSGLNARLLTDPRLFLTQVKGWQPTHIALDLVMPDMDGVQVLAQLSNMGCTAKIIITSGMSARVRDAAARAGIERGLNIVGVLAKPFAVAALRALLADAPKASGDKMQSPHAFSANISGAFHPAADELRLALARGEFFVDYQPKVECATGALAGFEALARWKHADRGIVMPEQFIHPLERDGLIDDLTETVLDQSLPWFSAFLRGAGRHASGSLSLSINFSVSTFADESVINALVAHCRKAALAPETVIIEVTDTRAMHDSVLSLDLATRLRMRGFQLSIDDFGSGYSSLLRLMRLPFSEIKIDHSLVSKTSQSAESRTVVESIVELSRNLGLKTVAEGVENLETLGYLKQIGCDLAQGYAIARPMNSDMISDWSAARENLRSARLSP